MQDYLEIGSTPGDEDCIQVGRGTTVEMHRESRAYLNQLRRTFGPEPEGARLAIETFEHEFGAYVEVICHFDSAFPESLEYAFRLEAHAPARWDAEARSDLRAVAV